MSQDDRPTLRSAPGTSGSAGACGPAEANDRQFPGAAEPAELRRLRRVEADLESAIAECRSALADVRRELRWQDPRNPSNVH